MTKKAHTSSGNKVIIVDNNSDGWTAKNNINVTPPPIPNIIKSIGLNILNISCALFELAAIKY